MTQFFDFEDGFGLVEFDFHPNGGGRVAATAEVDRSVLVSEGCSVGGFARVRGAVSITGRARISGEKYPLNVSTLIEDRVVITGNARIAGCVLLRDQVEVRDNVQLLGCVRAFHRAKMSGNVRLEGWVSVMDSAYLSGDLVMIGKTEQLQVRDETCLYSGVLTRANDVGMAVRRYLGRKEVARKRAAALC
ncbi:hypothetical protein ACSFA0_26015 [Variovorax sp. LT1P1]|uniref:hypothetical protein n=1 Tax=Variovorax sp. LT1P1 TaxID=3443730 RepID=UPI003F4726FA